MSQPTVEERIAALEQEVARLSQLRPGERSAPEKNWRSTRGMFAGDAIFKEIIDEGRKLRECDRQQTRE